jgi:primosomal protein N'
MTGAGVLDVAVRHVAVVPDTGAVLPQDRYTYSVPDHLVALAVPGTRVMVPFGRREVVGYVIAADAAPANVEARPITSVLDEAPILDTAALEIAGWVAARYCAPLGEVVRAMLPKGVRTSRPGGRKRGPRITSAAVEAARAGESGGAEIPPSLTDA